MTARLIHRRLFRTTVLSLSLLVLLPGCNRIGAAPDARGSQAISKKSVHDNPFSIRGISYKNYDNGRLVTRVSADEVKVDDRKFWIFNVRPFKEAVLDHAVIQLYLDGNSAVQTDQNRRSPDAHLHDFGSDILSIGRGMNRDAMRSGVISRGVIRDLTLEIYDSGRIGMTIESRKAYVDFSRKLLKMVDATMSDMRGGSIIKSRSVIWNSEKEVFEISGNYMKQSPEGSSKGKMIQVDMNFNISQLGSRNG